MLIAVTARSCGHCLDFEPTYRWAAPATEKYGVPLVRVDADREKDFIEDEQGLSPHRPACLPSLTRVPAAPVELTVRSYGVSAVQNLPVITVMHNCKSRGSYKGMQTPALLEEYAAKLVAPAARVLESLADTQAFADRYNVSVIGFFGGGGAEEEEDEEEDFREAAEALRYSHDVYFGVVRTDTIVKHFRDKAKWFKRTPSIVVLRNYDRGDQDRDMLLMTEHNDHSLASWILTASVRLADEVNAHNFAYYESLRLPMLMLFVNKTLDNTELLRGFKNAAKDHQRRISFVWIDGELYASRKARARPRGSPPHPPSLLRAPQHAAARPWR
jgi:hypothetical protein